MADPGFPVGGMDPLGGVDPQRRCFSAKMYVKTKELDPAGGVHLHAPRSANANYIKQQLKYIFIFGRTPSFCTYRYGTRDNSDHSSHE